LQVNHTERHLCLQHVNRDIEHLQLDLLTVYLKETVTNLNFKNMHDNIF